MINIEVNFNESGQRLDRFLKKYLGKASLSQIYKIIRKDLKLNGKRAKVDSMLNEGDVLSFYLAEDVFDNLRKADKNISKPKSKRQFEVVYEDDAVLIVEKPAGLLTHGSVSEKKNHLANQVISYLIENGSYNPRNEKTFVPAPCNRLDRNTAGLVIFGKTASATRALNETIKDKAKVRKYYLTIVEGELKKELDLQGFIVKDELKNKVTIHAGKVANSKEISTFAKPLYSNGKYTVVEVLLLTGRSHQIRAHLSSAGYPIAGDSKYGGKKINNIGLDTQFLYAYKLEFGQLPSELALLSESSIEIEPKGKFKKVKESLLKNGKK